MSGIDCVDFQIKPIQVGSFNLKNFGTIYGIVPNFESCNQDEATLSYIKQMICKDPTYEKNWMCRCINYRNNKSSLLANKQCETFVNNVDVDFPKDEMLKSNDVAESIVHAILAPNNIVQEEIVIRRTGGDF